jgi:Neutral/alkaline non-lysosomal ceramidase, N-terminal
MKSMVLLAGASTLDITPEPGLMMGGYGSRTEAAAGTHDPLKGRVLVLSDGTETMAIVISDLLGAPALLVEQVRNAASAHGLKPDNVLVAATHTHAGPSVVYTRRLNDYLVEAGNRLGGCIADAHERLRPALLRVGRVGLDSISQNRRDPQGSIQREAEILSVVDADDGSSIATLVNYACHATVLEADNLQWSADFPGAASNFIEQHAGGVALYMQGCCGDINPLWVKHDFDEVGRVGAIVGATVVRAIYEMSPLGGPGQFGINLSWSEEIRQDPHGELVDDVGLSSERVSVTLRRRPLPTVDELSREIADLERKLESAGGDDATRRLLTPRLNQLRMERTVQSYPQLQPPEEQTVEVQTMRLGSNCAIVSLPGEFFVATRDSLVETAAIDHLFIAGYANDYIGYVPPANEFANGGYEVGFARFAEDSEEALRTVALNSLRNVYKGVAI